jgi:hypothetical protein
MKAKSLVLAIAVLSLSLMLGGCYQDLAVRDFAKAGQQTLDGWHLIPFGDQKFTESGLSLGRATFSVPLILGEEFNLRIEIKTDLEGSNLNELGICLSQEKVYFSNLGNNVIIRTQSIDGVSNFEAYSVNFVVKDATYASGKELLPGFKLKGENTITVWKKGLEFGWTVNGKKSGPFKLPAEFANGIYVHLNVNAGLSSKEAIIIERIRITGPKDGATSW